MDSNGDNPPPMGGGTGPVLFRAISARAGGIGVAAALAAVGLVFAWQAAKLDFGDFSLPGPGFFPLILGMLVLALAAVTGARLWLGADNGDPVALGHRDVLIVFAALLAAPVLFEPLGAYVTLGLFGTAVLVLVARTPTLIAGPAAAAGMAACWYFFQVTLGVRLPAGTIWGLFTQVNG